MKNDKNAPAGDYHGDDGITGEYPVLFDPVRDATDSFEALNGTAPAGGAHDVTAVHEAAAALEATAAHDATVERPRLPAAEEVQVSGWLADLEAEIARLHDRWQQVEQGFTQKDGVIGELKTELAARDTALAEQRTRLESQAANLQTLERSLADKNGEIASLSAELTRRAAAQERDAAAMAGAAAAHQVTQRDLEAARAEVARLHTVIETEKAAVKALAARNDELLAAQAAMTLRIQELETYIDGRAQSWSSLKAEIAEQKGTILRLEKGLKSKDVSLDDAAREKRELEQRLVDLERQNSEISGRRKEREAAYEDLQRKLAEHSALAEQLKAELAKRISDHDGVVASAAADRRLIASLETAVRDRDAAVAALQTELAARAAAAEERQRALEGALAEREAALEQTRERADQQAKIATDLKSELDAKRSSVDLLQRSVHRISTLGASLADLERRIESSRSARVAPQAAAPTVAAAPATAEEPAELLPLESFLPLDGSSAGVAAERAPKLVGSLGGESVTFPLSKTEMTIGRGKASDIRISSHFISRLHAKISTRGIATTIEDIGSKNGIFVNANRIKRCVLRDGDVVSLASELELKFVDAAH